MKIFVSICQTVQPWERSQTDRHTDGTDFITSTADTGGKNITEKVGSTNDNKVANRTAPPLANNYEAALFFN